MANRPIPVKTAEEMMQKYYSYMAELGADMQYQTQAVSFNREFLDWMNEIVTFADEFRICFGATGESPDIRLTTIVWPYYNGERSRNASGEEIEPFNEGQGIP